MSSNVKVLVVGTTPEYIDWIRQRWPGRALFLTDPQVRRLAAEPKPSPDEELCLNLADFDQVRETLERHLVQSGLSLNGIAAFDCESMKLAAALAQDYHVPYPSPEAVDNCRDKFRTKDLWRRQGLPCPRTRMIRSETDAIQFFKELGRPLVLKPRSGSGSELIFLGDSEEAVGKAFHEIFNGLRQRRTQRLYRHPAGITWIIAEEFIEGEEYSCDFLAQGEELKIIRLSRKMLASDGPLGTARGYILPAALPVGVDLERFRRLVFDAARSVGLERTLGMLDFLVRDGEVFLLEIAPRPGGDCLPFLLRRAWNLDTLGLNLDLAQNLPLELPSGNGGRVYVGLRLHASHGGVLKKIDPGPLLEDKRVLEVRLMREPGHLIQMPPADYDSWYLGHALVRPDENGDLSAQCQEILHRLIVDIG
jgi:biotin carboxylase